LSKHLPSSISSRRRKKTESRSVFNSGDIKDAETQTEVREKKKHAVYSEAPFVYEHLFGFHHRIQHSISRLIKMSTREKGGIHVG
jgi:hypothetical protein